MHTSAFAAGLSHPWQASDLGGGRGHLVSIEVQQRNKELVKLQQKIIALLVKGNDHARRRYVGYGTQRKHLALPAELAPQVDHAWFLRAT